MAIVGLGPRRMVVLFVVVALAMLIPAGRTARADPTAGLVPQPPALLPSGSPGPVQPAPSPQAQPLRLGIHANAQGAGGARATTLDRARETGAKWVREDFPWLEVEPRKGQWNWTKYDALMAGAATRGMVVLPLLWTQPSWAGPKRAIPDNPSAFANYVARVAARYGPGGSFWKANPKLPAVPTTHLELWNEPYYPYTSYDDPNPARYARLVKAAAAAGRAANPATKYLIAADHAWNHTDWVPRMYDAVPDLNRYFDVVAIHPYSGSNSPDAYNPIHPHPYFRRLELIRQDFVAENAGDKPHWITEMGWPTCTRDPDYCVTEKQQADYLKRMFEMVTTNYRDFIQAVFIYHLKDWGPRDQGTRHYWFGLSRADGTLKPSWQVVRNVATQQASAR